MVFPVVNRGVGVVLVLQLALFVPPVQPWGKIESVSWNKQSPIRMMSAHSAVTTSYERIRMSEVSDAELAYPLVAAYLQRPELAHSVREFVYEFETPDGLGGLHDPGANRLPFAVSDSDHLAIHNHIDALKLPPETVQIMKHSLDWWRETERGRHSQPSPEPGSLFVDGTGARDYQEEMIYNDYASTVTALVLSLSPNITTLYLGDVWSGPLQEYLLKSNYGLTPLPALQRLQHVEHYRRDHGHMDMYDIVQVLDQFRYFHRLPQIASVSMEGVMDYQVKRDIFSPKTSRTIKKIHLGHSDLSGEMLATIIRIPTGLEEISVSIGGLWYPDGDLPVIDIGLLVRSLEQHKSTLQVLDVDLGGGIHGWVYRSSSGLDEDSEMGEEEDDYDEYLRDEENIFDEHLRDEYFSIDDASNEGPLHPANVKKPKDYDGETMLFRGYTALKRLSVNIEAIVSLTTQDFVDRLTNPRNRLVQQPPFRLVNALPPTLEYLCLYGYKRGEVPEVDKQVMELMERMDERLPNLREIRGIDTVEYAIVIDKDGDDDDPVYWDRPDVELGWVEA